MKNEFLNVVTDVSNMEPTNIIIRLPKELHQKVKYHTVVTGKTIKEYVTGLIEKDLLTTEFSEHEIPKEKLEGEIKNLIVTLEPLLHQKLRIATTMYGTSIQAYGLYLIKRDILCRK